MQCGPEINLFACQIYSSQCEDPGQINQTCPGQCQGQGKGQGAASVSDRIFLFNIDRCCSVATSAGILVEQPKKAS